MPDHTRLTKLLADPRIPTPPGIALQVLEKAGRPDCSIADLSRLISRDPSLCGRFLGLINSALFGLPQPVTSIDRALQLLGLRRVRSLVLALALPSMSCRLQAEVGLRFWRGSLVGALAAREMATRLRWPDPESELVAGLLRDVGVLALFQVSPEEYARVLADPAAGFVGRQCEVEQKVLGIDHAEVSAALLRQWHLPEELTEAIRHHHAPERMSARRPADSRAGVERVDLLHFATCLAALQSENPEPGLGGRLILLARDRFGVKQEQLFEFMAPLTRQVTEMGQLMAVDLAPVADCTELLRRSADELTQLAVEASFENLRLATENDQTQEALRKTEEKLRHALKMDAVGRVVGGVAHDFNNLLTAINGYTDLALAHLSPLDPVRAYILEVKKAGEKASVLTRQLLAFSRKQKVAPIIIDLNEVVTDMTKLLRRVISESITLNLDLTPDLRCIQADPGQLEQVVMNLVVNARDAMSQGGTLTIETSTVQLPEEASIGGDPRFHLVSTADVDPAPGHYARLVIRDTGCGMDRETLSQIFEPFFTTKGPEKGTGLGLATVYGIVKQAEGHITVESAPGLGTTFTIYWPHVSGSKENLRPDPAALPHGTETILLVDDEECVRTVASRALQMQGYTVLIASHPDEAVWRCSSHPGIIHLLVTDIIMPDMHGRELAARLRRLRPGMKILYMTGYEEELLPPNHAGSEETESAFAAGEVPLLRKPFGPQALAAKVRQILGHAAGG